MAITDADVPSEGVIGGIIDVAWTTTNQGSDTQYGNFSDRIYISDDEYLDESDIQVDEYYEPVYSYYYPPDNYYPPEPSFEAESDRSNYQSIELTGVDGELTPGDRYLLIVSDYEAEVIETDETNNILSVPFTLIDPEDIDVDLEVTSFTAPNVFEDNDSYNNFSISWTVSNLGTDNTHHSNSWKDKIYYSHDAILDDLDILLDHSFVAG